MGPKVKKSDSEKALEKQAKAEKKKAAKEAQAQKPRKKSQ